MWTGSQGERKVKVLSCVQVARRKQRIRLYIMWSGNQGKIKVKSVSCGQVTRGKQRLRLYHVAR